MAYKFTYEDFDKAAREAGLFDRFSAADLKLARSNPDAGMSILNYKKDYMNATTDEARALANQGAERMGTAKLQLRGELDAGASLTVAMQFDSDGVWREVSVLTASVKRSWYLPIIPRRSDHFRIRLTGTGMWRLYSLTREHYIGSEL